MLVKVDVAVVYAAQKDKDAVVVSVPQRVKMHALSTVSAVLLNESGEFRNYGLMVDVTREEYML